MIIASNVHGTIEFSTQLWYRHSVFLKLSEEVSNFSMFNLRPENGIQNYAPEKGGGIESPCQLIYEG